MGIAYGIVLILAFVALCLAAEWIQRNRKREAKAKEEQALAARTDVAGTFRCFISNRPLTTTEQLHKGMVSLGAFEALQREARAIASDTALEIEAKDIQGTVVKIVTIPWPEFTRYEVTPLDLKKQLMDSLIVGLGMGLGVGILILVICLAKVGFGPFVQRPLTSIGVTLFILASGAVIGLLFSFVPNLFRLRSDLKQYVLHKTDGSAIAFFVEPSQLESATTVLGKIKTAST